MNLDAGIGSDMACAGAAASKSAVKAIVGVKNRYYIECHDKDGNLKWTDYAENLVTNVGLNELLDKFLKGSGYTAAFYVGLTGGSPTPAAGDTMASHAGWSEFTTYTASSPNVRPTLTLGSVASQSVDNSASKAQFTIALASPDSQTIGGAFLCTNNTIGGTSGILYSIAAFSAGNKVLNSTDVLSVTVTCTAASA